MCQYSAKKGLPTSWHYKHLSSLVNSGAGGLMLESTAVNNEGKITHGDLGIFNKTQVHGMKKYRHLKKLNNKIPRFTINPVEKVQQIIHGLKVANH